MITCDSSSIITLSSNCLLWLLDRFETEFMIAPYVRKEIVDNPLNGHKYGFEAMRNSLVVGKSLKVGKTDSDLRDRIIKLSNAVYVHKGKPIEIVQKGEADALALAVKEGIKTLLVDEKNTRLLLEDKEVLRGVVEKRTKRDISINGGVADELDKLLNGMKAIRSSELVAVAIKRGYLDWPYPKKELMRNALISLKYSGCAISSGEITELVNLVAPTKTR